MLSRLIALVPEPIRRRHRSIGLGLLAFSFMVLSASTWDLYDEEPFLPWFWPPYFFMTAMVLWQLVLRPWSERLMYWSGAMVVMGYASRSSAAIMRWNYDPIQTPIGRVGVACTVFGSISLFALWFWVKEVKPWVFRHQIDETIFGD